MGLALAPHRIRQARLEAGLTLDEAAKAIPAARAGVHNYETGRSAPGGVVLGRMAAAYGVEPSYFYVPEAELDSSTPGEDTSGAALIGVRGGPADQQGE